MTHPKIFGNTIFSRGIQDRSPKGQFWKTIFSYKHVWMALVIYYGKYILKIYIMHLSIVLDIALGESSFKITLRFLVFY